MWYEEKNTREREAERGTICGTGDQTGVSYAKDKRLNTSTF